MAKLLIIQNKNFLALSANMIISVFSVLMMSLIYRSLNKEDVGSWYFFLAIFSLIETIRNGLLSTATIKFYAGTDKETGQVVLGSIWYLSIFITFVILILNLIFYFFSFYFKNDQVNNLIHWLGLTLLSNLPSSVTYLKLVADEDYKKILSLRLINYSSMVTILLFLLFFKKMSLEYLFILNIVTNVLVSLVCIIWKIGHIKSIYKRNKETIKMVFHFGKFNLATTLTSNLAGNVNTFLITFLLGPATLAVYNLPGRLMEIIELPLRSFVGTGMSSMAIALNSNKKEDVKQILKKYSGMVTFAFIPIILIGMLSANFAVTILGGAKYENSDAVSIFRFLLFFSILYPLDRFNGVTLDIMHKPEINFQKVIIILIANLVFTYVGVLIFKNIWGLIYFSPLVVIAGLVFGYYQLNKYLPHTYKEILLTGWKEIKIILQLTFNKIAHFKNK
jgi:O-antigen/teichoic acid export membrane protein